jgi:hypothetical protein
MPDKLIIDGYNLMYASDNLQALMRDDLEAAREKLLAEIEEYCARQGRTSEVVFDAGGRAGPASREKRSRFLIVIYTAKGQSADSYIEKLAYRTPAGPARSVLLVTGDYDQQKVAVGAGLLRMSSREFHLEMLDSREVSLEEARSRSKKGRRVNLSERLSEETKAALQRYKRHQ